MHSTSATTKSATRLAHATTRAGGRAPKSDVDDGRKDKKCQSRARESHRALRARRYGPVACASDSKLRMPKSARADGRLLAPRPTQNIFLPALRGRGGRVRRRQRGAGKTLLANRTQTHLLLFFFLSPPAIPPENPGLPNISSRIGTQLELEHASRRRGQTRVETLRRPATVGKVCKQPVHTAREVRVEFARAVATPRDV